MELSLFIYLFTLRGIKSYTRSATTLYTYSVVTDTFLTHGQTRAKKINASYRYNIPILPF